MAGNTTDDDRSERTGSMTYLSAGGVRIRRVIEKVDPQPAIESLIDSLDRYRGLLLASSYEVPGRYTRWDLGFARPPLALTARGRSVRVEALNRRGRVLIAGLEPARAKSFQDTPGRGGPGRLVPVNAGHDNHGRPGLRGANPPHDSLLDTRRPKHLR